MADIAADRLDTVMRGVTVLLVAQMQAAGTLASRNDGKPVDVLLVEAGYTQTEVSAILGRSQQAISDSMKKHSAPRPKSAPKADQ